MDICMESGGNKNMKILILTTPNPYKNAGSVALDLYKGLNSIRENEVKLLVMAWGKYPEKDIIPFESCFTHRKKWAFRKYKKILMRLKFIKPQMKMTNRDYSVQDYDQTITYYSTKSILQKINFKPDAIITQFMQNFLSYKNLKELNEITKAPVFLYMMDMAPMTGGCHYAWDCKAYKKKCGKCPALYSNYENDQSRKNWEFKNAHITETEITVIAGTKWQYQQLNQGSLFRNKPKTKILLAIDGNVFNPGNPLQARNKLNLPINKKIVFFGAVGINNRRKGFLELIEALKILKENTKDTIDIHLVIAGRSNITMGNNLLFDYTFLDHLDYNNLVLAFQAAEIFLCPSIEDSGPMMINQSIMCGTPVVAFEMGAAIDLVITGKTGYRAKLKDTSDLANGLQIILDLNEKEYTRMSENCRELGLELCHPKKQTEEFMKIIQDQIHK